MTGGTLYTHTYIARSRIYSFFSVMFLFFFLLSLIEYEFGFYRARFASHSWLFGISIFISNCVCVCVYARVRVGIRSFDWRNSIWMDDNHSMDNSLFHSNQCVGYYIVAYKPHLNRYCSTRTIEVAVYWDSNNQQTIESKQIFLISSYPVRSIIYAFLRFERF